MDPFSFIAGCVAGIAVVLFISVVFGFFRPWLRLYSRGGKGSLLYLFYMRLRGNPVMLIIDAYTGLLASGAHCTLREVEGHYVANQSRVTTADDLINSIRQDPVETHVAVWIKNDDAEWLGKYLSDRADAIHEEMDRNEENAEHDSDGRMAAEAERCYDIAIRANGAVAKVLRAQGREFRS